MKAFENRYSRTDRWLHRLSFASNGLQVSLADLEDRLYRARLDDIDVDRPTFVTALPRAGTTILLNLLYESGEFATHTYRSMPFVLCPLLWNRLSAIVGSRDTGEMERAHGDGIAISADSPEAFEEVIWRHFWPQNYRGDRIEPWHQESQPDFLEFLRAHMRKLVLLEPRASARRYVSKNNLNIARLDFLQSAFPNAPIIVLYRSPLQHAASLLRQHLKFLETHESDKFARDYMRGIGHLDFGDNFLPVNFGGWLDRDRRADAEELPFWVEYWTNAYRFVLQSERRNILLVEFEALCAEPRAALTRIGAQIGMQDPGALAEGFDRIRPAGAHDIDTGAVARPLLDAAMDIYAGLREATASQAGRR